MTTTSTGRTTTGRITTGQALLSPGGALEPWTFERRALRPDDLAVTVTHCGVCHSDLHALEAAGPADVPLVPGHEFAGVVAEVGSAVRGFAVGDRVVVGNIVDSCGTCPSCRAGQENYCSEFPTTTYGGTDRHDGTTTLGAYSHEYVVRERFAYPLPAGLDPAGAAPLMCAGVTVWEPLQHWQIGTGSRIGVVGLGGLGHLAVKFAVRRGAEVTVFTTSPAKREAAHALGAVAVVDSRDDEQLTAVAGTLDFVLDTASGEHDVSPLLRALRLDGTLCVLGLPERLHPETMALLGRRNLTVSGSAGRAATAAMLDFCGRHGITSDVEVLPLGEVRTALDRVAGGDLVHRLVLDVQG